MNDKNNLKFIWKIRYESCKTLVWVGKHYGTWLHLLIRILDCYKSCTNLKPIHTSTQNPALYTHLCIQNLTTNEQNSSKTYLDFVVPLYLHSFLWSTDFLFGPVPQKTGTSEATLFALMLYQPTKKMVNNHDLEVNTYCQNAIIWWFLHPFTGQHANH